MSATPTRIRWGSFVAILSHPLHARHVQVFVEPGDDGPKPVGVRKRVTREPVRADEPCATCGAPETVERARAAKAVVVGGAVLATYGAVENYACDRHAHRETLEAGAAQTPGATESEAEAAA